jgi:hypothetical protein
MDVKTQGLDVSGLDGFAKRLEALSAYAEGATLKAGAKAVAQAIADRARELAPAASGRLRAAIRVRAGRSGQGSFSFLASVGAKNFAGDQYYGAFQEFGWKSGSRKAGGNRKEIPGKHYMQQAAEEIGPSALATFEQAALAQLAKEVG